MGRRRTWTIEQLSVGVARSRSVAGVLRWLGLRISGGSYRSIQAHIKLHGGMDTSHWTRQGHRRGATRPPVAAAPLSRILVADRFYQSGKLKRRLLDEGVFKAECVWCHNSEWRGQPILLELDHIDGDHLNNQLVNLRLLCPNCHAQTPTYKGRNARYPNIPRIRDIEAGIQRCGSLLRYAQDLRVTPQRIRGWLRSDRIRLRERWLEKMEAESAVSAPSPGGGIGDTHGT